jgi:CheY-like chemotaxis protein
MSAGIVLVVDDEPTNIEIVAVLLERDGYEVTFATNGERALELVASVQPDLVLLDVMLPGIDGYAVCEHVKRDPATADIPVIFITGLDHVEDAARGLAAGGSGFLTKPFDPAAIRACVRDHIASRFAARRLN